MIESAEAAFFDKTLTIRSIAGQPGVPKLADPSVTAMHHFGGNTAYVVPPSPYNLLGSCDDPVLAAKIFSAPATYVGAPIYAAAIDGCLVSPTGAVITQDGSIVLESLYSHNATNFLQGFGKEFEEINGRLGMRRGPVARAGSVIYNRDVGEYGYFHWINSILPRFGLVPHLDPAVPRRFLVTQNTAFAKRSLELLGVQPGDVVPVFGGYQLCDRLIFLSPWVIGGNHWTRPPEIKNFYQGLKAALDVTGDGGEDLIYLSRNDASVRRLSNEADALQVLARYGCRAAVTTGMNLEAQAAMFHRARLCVSVHGAGLSNIVFMQPGAKVVEIISPDRLWPTYRSLAARMGLSYTAISGTRVAGGATGAPGSFEAGNDDFTVSLPGLDYIMSVLH